MKFAHYSDDTVGLAEELVNTLGAVSGDDALDSVGALAGFLATHAEPWAGTLPAPSEADLADVRALRKRLRTVFETPDQDRAASVINAILEDNGALPRVSTHGGQPHLHFEPADAGVARWLGVVTGMGLATVLAEGGLARLGVCQSETCDDVYIDTSRNRSRLHCSITCGTREHVAAHRKRRRGESEDAASGIPRDGSG